MEYIQNNKWQDKYVTNINEILFTKKKKKSAEILKIFPFDKKKIVVDTLCLQFIISVNFFAMFFSDFKSSRVAEGQVFYNTTTAKNNRISLK